MKIKKSVYVIAALSVAALCIYRAYQEVWIPDIASCVAYPMLKINQHYIEPIKKWLGEKQTDDFANLKRQNQLLQLQNIRLRAALAYARNIKELHLFNERFAGHGHIAQIIARNITQDSHYFLIDAGNQKGIEKDMVVLHNNNLIGKIVEVYPWYSKACLITDRTCKVAAYCAQTGAHGIYEGCNEQTSAALNFVNHLSDIQTGDLVLSSGEGLIFPEGFALGRVNAYSNDGLYKQVTVEPLCNIRDIDYCLVMAKG